MSITADAINGMTYLELDTAAKLIEERKAQRRDETLNKLYEAFEDQSQSELGLTLAQLLATIKKQRKRRGRVQKDSGAAARQE